MSINWTRTARNTSAAVVAGIAGYASYWHQTAVALRAGERTELAHLIPLSVDGMLIVASIAMVDDRQNGRKPRLSAKIAFALGILASVGANVAAAHPTALGRTVAAWPALALLLVVEILSRRGKLIAEPVVAPVVVAEPVAQAVRVIEETAKQMPVPTSPAPVGQGRSAVVPARPAPRPARNSPLTGKPLGV